jgi:hypothetical protein
MKNIALLTVLFASSGALAVGGPTSIGTIRIGMSKGEYISAIGINPTDCNTFKNKKDDNGDLILSEIKYITSNYKKLCKDYLFRKTGSTENINVGDISYDVVNADYESSNYIRSIGNSIEAIFIKDRLIRIKMYSPKVSFNTLSIKYGSPNIVNKKNIEICKNNTGDALENIVNEVDGVWSNGEVNAILSMEISPPLTCNNIGSNIIKFGYYIIEERKQLELIEASINNFRKEIDKATAKDSPF